MKDCDSMSRCQESARYLRITEVVTRLFFGKFWEGTLPATSWLQRSSKTAWSDGKETKVNFSAAIDKGRINHPRRAGRVCTTGREKQVSGCLKTADQERQ